MKTPKTIRLEPGLKSQLEALQPKGVPEQVVLHLLLEIGMQQAKRMTPEQFLAAAMKYRLKLAVDATERRIEALQGAVRSTEGD